jgi:hypothetical protein
MGRANSADYSSMKCRTTAATRVASLNVTDYGDVQRRERRTDYAAKEEFRQVPIVSIVLLSRHQPRYAACSFQFDKT